MNTQPFTVEGLYEHRRADLYNAATDVRRPRYSVEAGAPRRLITRLFAFLGYRPRVQTSTRTPSARIRATAGR